MQINLNHPVNTSAVIGAVLRHQWYDLFSREITNPPACFGKETSWHTVTQEPGKRPPIFKALTPRLSLNNATQLSLMFTMHHSWRSTGIVL